MGRHTLPELPYAYDALEPHIDARTMEIHHTHHHQSYVDQLNTVLDRLEPSLQELTVEDLLRHIDKVPEDLRKAVRNYAGGHANHSLWWTSLAPGGGNPSGALAKALDESFGSFEDFRGKFRAVATNHFGSGWAWLFMAGGKLVLYSLPNEDSPLMVGESALLGLDLWEHAHYLKHEWRRDEYIESFWNVVNWEEVGRRYEGAVQSAQSARPRHQAHHT
jgi:superoxide dismutase, Fe-Mn family